MSTDHGKQPPNTHYNRAKAKEWFGTIWSEEDKQRVKELIQVANYGVISDDDHTKENQLHWHCLLVFDKRTRPTAFKTKTTHWEVAMDGYFCVGYCKAKGENFLEKGEYLASGGTSQKWKAFVDYCKDKTPKELIDGPFSKMYAQYRGFAGEVSNQYRKPKILDGDLKNEWYWGPPGTGKTRKAWDDNPDLYVKSINKWWDGYNNEETVLIDDWDPQIKGMEQKLKTWSDRYPFRAETKGSSLMIRPKKFIITSNYSPDDCFQNEEDRLAIRRRFNVTQFHKLN